MISRFAMSGAGCVILAVACSSSNGGGTATTAQKLGVGSPCTQDSDCGSAPFMCMMTDHPGGYCMRNCDISKGDGDCPSESVCQFDGMVGECHLKCSTQGDCRAGYVCSPAASDSNNKVSHAMCDVAPMGDGGAGHMDTGKE
jgi:hypothetical protein